MPIRSDNNSSLPFITTSRTQPPGLLIISSRNHRRQPLTVERRMPFFSNIRVDSMEIICAGYQSPSATCRTPITSVSTTNVSLPLMSFNTSPPDFSLASRSYLCGQQIVILFIMPFLSKLRVCGLQIVISN